MKLDFCTRNYTLNENLRDLITRKLDRLCKFLPPDAKIKVLLRTQHDTYVLELTLPLNHSVLRAEVSSDDMAANIDLALPKLEKQILKYNQRQLSRSKRDRARIADEVPDEAPAAIVRKKSFALIDLSVDQAVEELEHVGHAFYVFRNAQTGQVNVVYRRTGSGYGLIETT